MGHEISADRRGFLFAFDLFRYSDALLIRQFSDVSSGHPVPF